MTGPTVEQFIAEAQKEVGYVEAPTNRTKFAAEAAHPNGFAWCMTFLAALARRTGLRLPSGVVGTAYTPTAADAFRRAKAYHADPRPGDWAFFDFPADSVNRISHVGVVVSVHPDGTITTIEGNTSPSAKGDQRNGGGVYVKRRPRRHVVGYGRPAYAAPVPKTAPAPVVIVKRGSVEDSFLSLYPRFFGDRPIRRVDPDPKKDLYAAGHPDDIAFGVPIWGAKQVRGKDRYETLQVAFAYRRP